MALIRARTPAASLKSPHLRRAMRLFYPPAAMAGIKAAGQ